MHVGIVTFPKNKVAVIEQRGLPKLEYETARKLIAWKLDNRLLDQTKFRSYGFTTPAHSTRRQATIALISAYPLRKTLRRIPTVLRHNGMQTRAKRLLAHELAILKK